MHVNIPQAVIQHSPDGFEWGYGGSGPADFALNILHLFLPPLPEDGGTIAGAAIRAWIAIHSPALLDVGEGQSNA